MFGLNPIYDWNNDWDWNKPTSWETTLNDIRSLPVTEVWIPNN